MPCAVALFICIQTKSNVIIYVYIYTYLIFLLFFSNNDCEDEKIISDKNVEVHPTIIIDHLQNI